MAPGLSVIRQLIPRYKFNSLKFVIMKKLFIATVMVLGMNVVSFAHQAPMLSEAVQMAAVGDFTPVDLKEVPQVVLDAVAKAYPGAAIKSAAVETEEDGMVVYQFTLAGEDEVEFGAFFTDKGEELK